MAPAHLAEERASVASDPPPRPLAEPRGPRTPRASGPSAQQASRAGAPRLAGAPRSGARHPTPSLPSRLQVPSRPAPQSESQSSPLRAAAARSHLEAAAPNPCLCVPFPFPGSSLLGNKGAFYKADCWRRRRRRGRGREGGGRESIKTRGAGRGGKKLRGPGGRAAWRLGSSGWCTGTLPDRRLWAPAEPAPPCQAWSWPCDAAAVLSAVWTRCDFPVTSTGRAMRRCGARAGLSRGPRPSP